MNTKEKLTEIISNVVVNDKGNRIRDVFHPEFVEKIVESLIVNGAIMPPCKVGDTVYYITGIHNTLVKEAKVEEIYVGEAGFAFHLCHDYTYFTVQQEDVFLTREEAEAALKGRESNGRK